MGNILNDPSIQNQLWALLSVGIAWLIGKGVSWGKGQLSDTQSALLDRVEAYARQAAAWALVHFPGLGVPDLATKGEDKLRDILRTQGITIPDSLWTHLTQVVEGFVVEQLAARHTTVAPPIAHAPTPGVASGILPKATP